MKKILVVHNKYQNIGGEDISVNEEIKLLSELYNVETIYFENNVKGFLNLFFTFLILQQSKKVIEFSKIKLKNLNQMSYIYTILGLKLL